MKGKLHTCRNQYYHTKLIKYLFLEVWASVIPFKAKMVAIQKPVDFQCNLNDRFLYGKNIAFKWVRITSQEFKDFQWLCHVESYFSYILYFCILDVVMVLFLYSDICIFKNTVDKQVIWNWYTCDMSYLERAILFSFSRNVMFHMM